MASTAALNVAACSAFSAAYPRCVNQRQGFFPFTGSGGGAGAASCKVVCSRSAKACSSPRLAPGASAGSGGAMSSATLRDIPSRASPRSLLMLGPPKPRRLDEPIAVSLEDLVPQDHFYRHLERSLDLSFVREWTRERYADRGRPSIDPVVFFKLQFIMFFEGIRSERQLIEKASLNLAHWWYLGYALDESLPDHSSLTRIRQRLGVDIFQRFFEQIVDLCQEAGLVWGRELYVDATKAEANAALDSLRPRFYHDAKAHVADLFADDALTDPATAGPDAAADALPVGIARLPSAAEDEEGRMEPPPWQLLEEHRLDPDRPSVGSYRRTTDFRVSSTDPDATPMRTKHGTSLGYHDHDVVDGGKQRIILAAFVTPADVMENVCRCANCSGGSAFDARCDLAT
jgi:transposase